MTTKRQKNAPGFQAKAAARFALSGEEMLSMLARASERREARNGFTEAMEVLVSTLPKAFAKTGGPTEEEVRHRIIDEIYGPMLDDRDFTESAMKEGMKAAFDSGANIDIVEEAVAYCVFAIRAYFIGNDALSWSYACDARHWSAIVLTIIKRGEMPKPGVLLAQIRHRQTRKEYEAIESYWKANIARRLSAQKAANEILLAGASSLSHKKIAEIVSALRRGETFR
ncbi:hypothetical protein [Rhodanobacter thiooxydans]|uniref:hypothetical protein n=1 Tax=Rhodanobacter thiooxydans TaxID=416169 RepID=UPI00131F3D27|nr:hypothetical protein [Rhodanobacter thiooxydans]